MYYYTITNLTKSVRGCLIHLASGPHRATVYESGGQYKLMVNNELIDTYEESAQAIDAAQMHAERLAYAEKI